MTSERMLQVAGIALRANELPGITVTITIGNEGMVFLHDTRDEDSRKWNCTIYLADGRKSEKTDSITYIEDWNFDAAEARLRQVLEEAKYNADNP